MSKKSAERAHTIAYKPAGPAPAVRVTEKLRKGGTELVVRRYEGGRLVCVAVYPVRK